MNAFAELKSKVKRLAAIADVNFKLTQIEYSETFPVDRMQHYDADDEVGYYDVWRKRDFKTLNEIKTTFKKQLAFANKMAETKKNFDYLNRMIKDGIVHLNFATRESWEHICLHFINKLEARKAAIRKKEEKELVLKRYLEELPKVSSLLCASMVTDFIGFFALGLKESIFPMGTWCNNNQNTDLSDYQYFSQANIAGGISFRIFAKVPAEGDIIFAVEFKVNGKWENQGKDLNLKEMLKNVSQSLASLFPKDYQLLQPGE